MILLRLVLFVDVLIKAKLKGFQGYTQWCGLSCWQKESYNLQKKLVDAIFTQPPLGLFLKKFQKCIAFHFPYAMLHNCGKQSASLYTGEEDMKGMVSLQIIDTELQSADLK